MAIDPKLLRKKILAAATERATKKIGTPVVPPRMEGSLIHVRSAQGQMTFRYWQSLPCNADRVPYVGSLNWGLEELKNNEPEVEEPKVQDQPSFWRRVFARTRP